MDVAAEASRQEIEERQALEREVERLRERVAELEADKARLDWLESGGDLRRDFICAVAGAPAWWTPGRGANWGRPHYSTAREAIDAAMNGG